MTDFSGHDSVCKLSSQAPAQLFLLLLQKVDISTIIVLYSCDVQYHMILYWCFSMGPWISKTRILAVAIAMSINWNALAQNFWQSLSPIVSKLSICKKKQKKTKIRKGLLIKHIQVLVITSHRFVSSNSYGLAGQVLTRSD